MKANQTMPPLAHLGLIPLLAALSLSVCAAGSTVSAPSAGIPSPRAKHSVDPNLSLPHAPGNPGHVTRSRIVIRQPGESPEQLAERILPSGAYSITKPLEFQLPPLGRVILILYEASSDDPSDANDPSVYRGWVLVPEGTPDAYRVEPLPSQPAGVGRLMYEVKSVFAADADRDGAPEICILSEIEEAGRGDSGRPFTDTDVFKWSGSGFKLLGQSDNRPLYNLRNAAAVRARLKKVHLPQPRR
jgi:hypothetical protein